MERELRSGGGVPALPIGLPENGRELIGILGGMGPAATVDFYGKLVMSTPARKDQDHPPVVIWADPTVPDRSEALLGQGPDPTPWLLHGSEMLVAAGATVIVIPCNTAHAFLSKVTAHVSIPVVSMIDAAARLIHVGFSDVRQVGILATTGTIDSLIYHRALAAYEIELLTLDHLAQATLVTSAIDRIKAGLRDEVTGRLLEDAASQLVEGGAELVIAGCTEVVLGLTADKLKVPLVDPAQALVDELLGRLGYHTAVD